MMIEWLPLKYLYFNNNCLPSVFQYSSEDNFKAERGTGQLERTTTKSNPPPRYQPGQQQWRICFTPQALHGVTGKGLGSQPPSHELLFWAVWRDWRKAAKEKSAGLLVSCQTGGLIHYIKGGLCTKASLAKPPQSALIKVISCILCYQQLLMYK